MSPLTETSAKCLQKAQKLDLASVKAACSYECAVVFDLPVDLIAHVESLRHELDIPAPDLYQLRPHLTLLYCGRVQGSSLLALDRVLALLPLEPVRVSIGGGLRLFVKNERIVNVHLPARPAAPLRALHRQVLASFEGAGWQPQTEYVGDRYEPHVTVFDRVDVDLSRGELLKNYSVVDREVELQGPSWMGLPLEP